MPAPVQVSDFESYTGLLALTTEEQSRVEVMLGRASRALKFEVTLPDDPLSDDDEGLWKDAVSELAWYYWEQEKAGVMEILALPVSQLSLGTLFWTKESGYDIGGLRCVNQLFSMFGNVARKRIKLEDEIGYPA